MPRRHPARRPVSTPNALPFRERLSVFRYTPRAIALVWQTSRRLTLWIATLSLVAGLVPAAIAWVGKEIVDAVVEATSSTKASDLHAALHFVALELGLVAIVAGAQRGIETCSNLLRARLAQEVNVLVLQKALSLDLRAFEDPEVYDSMSRARREASIRPLSVVQRVFRLAQQTISLFAYGVLLAQLSLWAVVVLVAAALPAFIAETRFSKDAFRLFSWRAPETRKQNYLETLIAREDNVKEVKLFSAGPVFLQRYQDIFESVYDEDRALQVRRGVWGFALGLLSSLAFYAAYAWIVLKAVAKTISLGDMTMYLMLFKQGQSAFSSILASIGGMYEDNLYLSNLYEFLAHPSEETLGDATSGPDPADGLRFENVTFQYPGAERPAVSDVSFHLQPGEKVALVGENGAGKTTLIKLLTRLYDPTSGRITLDGRDLREWQADALRRRIGVIFQDFVRYQLLAGENIGVGDIEHLANEERWQRAAKKGMADVALETLPDGYHTQLGRWFGGQELSIGQWQKVALARAFMREGADILVLDEPTASMDAEAEAMIFERFRALSEDSMAMLISHRFSTVRMADTIVVLEQGRIVERGTHDSLVAAQGRYARLFELQAAGYR